MNIFILSGNLSRDPWIADSEKVAKITVAVSKGYSMEREKEEKAKGNQTADYIEVTIFSEAQIGWVKTHLKKGDGVLCTCKVHNSKPRETVNSEGIPVIRVEQLIAAQRIEVVNRRSAAEKEAFGETIAAAIEEEEDPIQSTTTLPPTRTYQQQTFNDDEW